MFFLTLLLFGQITGTEEVEPGAPFPFRTQFRLPFPDDLIQRDTKTGMLQTKKASDHGCLSLRGRLPTLPLSQYHRRGKV